MQPLLSMRPGHIQRRTHHYHTGMGRSRALPPSTSKLESVRGNVTGVTGPRSSGSCFTGGGPSGAPMRKHVVVEGLGSPGDLVPSVLRLYALAGEPSQLGSLSRLVHDSPEDGHQTVGVSWA